VDQAGQNAADGNIENEICRRHDVLAALLPARCDQVRWFQPGIGNTGLAIAAASGSTTVGTPPRFCSTIEAMVLHWPLASNSIGPPTITRFSILVARIASASA